MNNQSTTTDIQKNLSNNWLIKAALYCSAWHWVLLNVHHLVAFWIRSQSSLHWRSTFRKKLMVRKCKGCLNRKVENLWITISCIHCKRLKSLSFGEPRLEKRFFIFAYYENFMSPAWVVEKFEFWRARLGQTPIEAPPIFVTFSLFLIFTHLKNLIHLALTV